MARFVVTRIFQSVLTLFGVLTAAFFLVRLAGDPATLLLPAEATGEDIAALRRGSGSTALSSSTSSSSAGRLAGDFGVSMRQRTSALGLVLERVRRRSSWRYVLRLRHASPSCSGSLMRLTREPWLARPSCGSPWAGRRSRSSRSASC